MFKKSTQRIQNNNNRNGNLGLIFNMRPSNAVIAKPNITLRTAIRPPQKTQNDEMTWGKPIWYFLHSFASNIKDDAFIEKRQEILKLIFLLCINLPCHICSEHAKQYLNGINFNNIVSKDDLIHKLYLFHNSVNKRKNYPLYKESDLSKYNDVNMTNVVNNFIRAYNSSNKLNIYSMSRNESFSYIKKWLHANYNTFM
jgi:hypothetical protein